MLACHWRHPFAERTASTAELHAVLDLPKQCSYTDADLQIDVWTAQDCSVAGSDGLLG